MASVMPFHALQALDIEQALQFLSAGGLLSQHLKGFESREQQKEMMRDIALSFNQNKIALIEAGTGTGKSISYLLPALLWALKFDQCTVISTNTINLQEQLLHKDIPLLLNALKMNIKAEIVKGMGNYVCLRKMDEAKLELPLLTPLEKEEWDKLEAFIQNTEEGSRTSLPMVPSAALWEKAGAEYDTCNQRDCRFFKECFFYKARRQAEDAKILIVNHHLLCSDLVARKNGDEGVLPPYQRVILDEAHNIEDIATDFFARRFSQLGFLRNLSRLSAEKQGKASGKLPLLKHLISLHFRQGLPAESSSIFTDLNIELPSLRNEIWNVLSQTCEAFKTFACTLQQKRNEEDVAPGENLGEIRLRLLKFHQTHPLWDESIVPISKSLIHHTMRYVQILIALESKIVQLKNERLQEQIKGPLYEIKALINRLSDACKMLEKFIAPLDLEDKVRWIEIQNLRTGTNTLLYDADLDVSKELADSLFNKFSSTALVSATLTTNKHFDFIRSRLGLTLEHLQSSKPLIQSIYDSPFNYKEQVLLAIPTDLPEPSHPNFIAGSAERIWEAIQASRGNAFVLFTSYSMLKSCYHLLQGRLKENRYNVLKQGDTNRQALLTQFKQIDKSVLFGTDSFWEGVDVAGEALRCVILVKLPFKVPSEPIVQARSESIAALGKDPFLEYTLPMAIVKFKQGFGRLIRNRRDRGCIVCLDGRLLTKGYGKLFLNSLPDCQQIFAESPQVFQAMREFYRKTLHLTRLP